MQKLSTQPTEDKQERFEVKTIKSTLYSLVNTFIILVLALASYVKLYTSIELDLADLAYNTLLLWVCGYIVYSNALGSGELKGQGTDMYKDALAEAMTSNKTLTGNKNIEYLYMFVQEQREIELNSRRRAVIGSATLSWEKWQSDYIHASMRELRARRREVTNAKGKTVKVPYFERHQLVAILRCKTMRYKSFSVLQLTSPVGAKGEQFIAPSADSVRKAIKTRRALTSVVFMLIVANFAVEMVQDFTFATAVECIVSLVPVAWAWVSGWFSGWHLSTTTAIAHFLGKAKWCNRAVAWLDKYTPETEKREEQDAPLDSRITKN